MEIHERGHSGRTTKGDWLAGLIPAAVFIVLYCIFGGKEWLDWLAIGIGVLLIIAIAVVLIVLKKRSRKVSPKLDEGGVTEEPYEIRDPLFKRIMQQYEEDGLSDFVNYVSLRGWKLGYVDAEEDSLEFIFLRHEHQVMVSLFDGYAEMIAGLQSEHWTKIKLDYSDFNEPIELWNAIITEVRSATRAAAAK